MPAGELENDLDSRRQVDAPAGMDGQRPDTGLSPQPAAHDGVPDPQRAGRAPLIGRPLPGRGERAMGHADRGQIEFGAEMQRQTGPARMITGGGVQQ
jgi:hypothetical protein